MPRIPTDLEGVYINKNEISPGVFSQDIYVDQNSPYYGKFQSDPNIQGYMNTFGGAGGGFNPDFVLNALRSSTGQHTVPGPNNTNPAITQPTQQGGGFSDLTPTQANPTQPTQPGTINLPANPTQTAPQTPTSVPVGPAAPSTTSTNVPNVSVPPLSTSGTGFSGLTGTMPTLPNATLPQLPVAPGATQTQTDWNAYANSPTVQAAWQNQQLDPNTPNVYPNINAYAQAYYNNVGQANGDTLPTTVVPSAPTNVTATVPSIPGGNYQQVQNANQGGQFTTVGSNVNQEAQTSGQTQQTAQTQQTTGTTTGTATSTPTDTLGFGALLQGQAGQVGASDTARNAFLNDVMTTGGSQFNSQLDAGIRNALSGPQLTGAGDSARARMGGYAAASVGRENLGQRLGAAQQLSGPTGLATLSSAANPYIGQTQTNTGTTSGASTLQGLANTTGFSNLVSAGQEQTAGSANAQSSQAGAGQIPEGQPVKTGGCVLCTAGIELGLGKHHRVLRRVIAHKLHKDWPRFRNAARGYFALFTPLAVWLLRHPKVATVLWPLAKGVVYEELRVSGRALPRRNSAWCVHWAGHALCAVVGKVFPVKGYVDDPTITEIARRNGILFNVEE